MGILPRAHRPSYSRNRLILAVTLQRIQQPPTRNISTAYRTERLFQLLYFKYRLILAIALSGQKGPSDAEELGYPAAISVLPRCRSKEGISHAAGADGSSIS